jgi:hypothetical protein
MRKLERVRKKTRNALRPCLRIGLQDSLRGDACLSCSVRRRWMPWCLCFACPVSTSVSAVIVASMGLLSVFVRVVVSVSSPSSSGSPDGVAMRVEFNVGTPGFRLAQFGQVGCLRDCGASSLPHASCGVAVKSKSDIPRARPIIPFSSFRPCLQTAVCTARSYARRSTIG